MPPYTAVQWSISKPNKPIEDTRLKEKVRGLELDLYLGARQGNEKERSTGSLWHRRYTEL